MTSRKPRRRSPHWRTRMPAEDSLAKRLYDGAGLSPGAAALIGEDESVSYTALVQRVERYALALQHLLPERGSRVALCAANHIEHLLCYIAILVAGYVWVPMNPKNGRALNSVILKKAAPDLLLTDMGSRANAPESGNQLLLGNAAEGIHSIAEISSRLPYRNFTPHIALPDDIAAIKFTGGTTGEPKGVMQTHANMLAVMDSMQSFYRFSARDCNLAVAPLTHGSSHYVFPVLAMGGRHRFVDELSADRILAALRSGTTVTFMPPTLIYKLMDSASAAPADFLALRHLTYSAAPMPVERIRQAQAIFGPCISTVYGQTEAPLMISALSPAEMLLPEKQSTVGRAGCGCEIRIVDDEGRNQPAGSVGNISVKGPIVMPGYLDDPGQTARVLRDGWLITGDLGHLDDDGYLSLVGRASELIITGGFNVFPAEVENAVVGMPGIRECCVFGVADDHWGERIEAAVTVADDFRGTQSDILDWVRIHIGPIRTPKAVHIVTMIPRNAVGKIVRRDMPKYLRLEPQ